MSLLLLFPASGEREVWISPTDDVDDVDAVQQTITADSATEITFTAVQGGLSSGTNLYLFVVTAQGASNASGFIVQFEAGGFLAFPHPRGMFGGMHRLDGGISA